MRTSRALVVDDEPKIRALLRNCLEEIGLSVTEADCAGCALRETQSTAFDLITLDLHLGEDDGLDVAKSVRAHSDVPIIMVTGKGDVIDRVVGLEIGADDYITKPFHVREVLARVRAVLRRSQSGRETQDGAPLKAEPTSTGRTEIRYKIDGLTIIPDRFELRKRDDSLSDLTTGDFKLLRVFLERPKRILSREQLMDLTGGHAWTPLDRTVDNQVARLRKKIERDPSNPQLIKTVRGIGYTLSAEVQREKNQSSRNSA